MTLRASVGVLAFMVAGYVGSVIAGGVAAAGGGGKLAAGVGRAPDAWPSVVALVVLGIVPAVYYHKNRAMAEKVWEKCRDLLRI